MPFPYRDRKKQTTITQRIPPDLPGFVATGSTLAEVKKNIHEAIEMHVQGLLEDNSP